MDLKTLSVDVLFASPFARFCVPKYQRHYVWREEEWDSLWKDIELIASHQLEDASKPKSHFMGFLLTRRDGNDGYEVIDGQQRLTTLQIILCCIRDIWDSQSTLHVGRRFKYSYLLTAPDESCKKLKLQPGDDEVFGSIIAGEKVSRSDSILWQARSYFRSVIRNSLLQNGKICSTKFDCLCNTITTGCTFVHLDVGNDQQPERLFESINGRGRQLGQWDLLRNNLYLRAGQRQRGEELFKMHWDPVFGHSTGLWDLDREGESFLRIYLRIKLGRRYHSIETEDLYAIYRDNLMDLGPCGVEEELKELAMHGTAYSLLKEHGFTECIERLERLDSNFSHSQVIAFAVFVYVDVAAKREGSCARNVLRSTLEVLEAYAQGQSQPDGADGRNEPYPLSKKNPQFSNIIDIKREFVLRDLINWLDRDWREPSNAQGFHGEFGIMEDAFRQAGVFRQEAKLVANAEEARRRYVENEKSESCKLWFLRSDGSKVQSARRVSDGRFVGRNEVIVETDSVVVAADKSLLEKVGHSGVECNDDGLVFAMLKGLGDKGFIVASPGRQGRDGNRMAELIASLELLRTQSQDPVYVFILSKFGHKILGRMGSYDESMFFLRCDGNDIIVPRSSIAMVTPIYEGLIIARKKSEEEIDWGIMKVNEKKGPLFRGVDSKIHNVVRDIDPLGEPQQYERVWFWLRPPSEKTQYPRVEGAVRVEEDRLSTSINHMGWLKYWQPEYTYGWMEIDQIGDVMVHESAFRKVSYECDVGERVGEMFTCNIVERYGNARSRRRLLQARNVRLVNDN